MISRTITRAIATALILCTVAQAGCIGRPPDATQDVPTPSAQAIATPPQSVEVSLSPFVTPSQSSPISPQPVPSFTPVPTPQAAQTWVAVRDPSHRYTFYSYDQLQADIAALADQYPEMLTRRIIGHSAMGRSIDCLRIGNPNAERKVIIVGATHAREHVTSRLITDQIKFYLERLDTQQYQSMSYRQILQQVCIDYIPMLNPDGVMLSQEGLDSVIQSERKPFLVAVNKGYQEFTYWKANANGVDLNRNFDARWERIGDAGGFSSEGYKGSQPESEPESRAIADYIRQEDHGFLISYHSMGNVIFWGFEQTFEERMRDQHITQQLCSLTGYAMSDSAGDTASAGGLKDWFVDKRNHPGMTIEVCTAQKTYPIEDQEYEDIFLRNRYTGIYAADYLRRQ